MAPVIKKLKEKNIFDVKICVTAQHREMLDKVLKILEIIPDYDLNIMKKNQDLYDITSNILLNLKDVFDDFKPDLIMVHGDTTTTFSASLAAFYQKIDIAHIEAGLRSGNIYSPYPEEANRKMTSVLVKYHFAPTLKAKENLLKEGVSEKNIIVTGNTVIDSLLWVVKKIENDSKLKEKILKRLNFSFDSKFILVTGHRRENFGRGFLNICEALKEITLKHKDINIVYPVHLNPNVREPVNKILKGIENIRLIEPLNYLEFVYLMKKSYLILTDSGGVQEEAPSLNKPVLVMKDTTERPEGIEAGCLKLVGTDKEKIIKEVEKLLNDKNEYEKMSKCKNPYGDGKASDRIVKFLRDVYETNSL
ncbi:MAG: UDP-N-acetylglucosamine 2-epimerase (non-hydrolyzing) [Nautiliaceae bacterium]